MSNAVDDLQTLIRTRHAVVRIVTSDENHAVELIARAATALGLPVNVWTVTDGLRPAGRFSGGSVPGADTIGGALAYLRDNPPTAVHVFCGALRVLTKPADIRLLREVGERFSGSWATLFLVDPDGGVPIEAQPFTVPYEIPLPDEKELRRIVRACVEELRVQQAVGVTLGATQFEQFIQALRGLTRVEARQLVGQCLLDDDRLDVEDIARVLARKRQRLGEAGVLTYVSAEDAPRVGGMKNLRHWLRLRREALSERARQFGLDPPRGILLLGVQGCGKSLMARATAAEWRMPLLRMDVGALYDKFIGETERHLRRALQQAEAMAPCVLWMDEIEKAFASAASHNVDGGLSQRMFGALLTWLQDHRQPVFVVATANDIAALPPELIRKGRFDEIFFVDLPDAKARAQIAAIHLMRRQRDYRKFDVRAIAAACEGYSGAEIEQAVVSAMYAAFAANREVTTEDIVAEVRRSRPLSVTASERIEWLRNWAAERCMPAD